ncbi:hypothetical protein HY345_00735 [Candidatus Microgenomates bacterium]|nr:hypothetical protein [Candidatus Microgenomates bacterium]
MTSKKLTLQNSTVSLTVLPIGAKITSLKYHGQELVFLPSQQVIDNYSPYKDQVFDETVAWGGDICAPSVSACMQEVDDYRFKVSDHGNFWTTMFTTESFDSKKALLRLKGVTEEFNLVVSFFLQGNILKREYEVVNNTKYNLPFTFADHLLLPPNKNKKPEEYLNFPGVSQMRIEWSNNNLLGEKNSSVGWPLSRKGIYADKLFGKLDKQNDLYRLTYLNNGNLLTFSSPQLSYVGYWQTNGGWNNSYNLGVELTNTDRDNLAEGVKENKVWWIKQGESKKWSIDLEIISS